MLCDTLGEWHWAKIYVCMYKKEEEEGTFLSYTFRTVGNTSPTSQAM